jgi:hypothetical protein
MQQEMIQNVHISVDRIFNTPQYRTTVKTANDSIQLIYRSINSTYTDFHWIATMKQAQPINPTNADTYYYNCRDCFATRAPGSNYEFLISGVPVGSTPNTAYVQQKAFFTVSNKFNSAKQLANYIYNGFCLAGIEAISMYEDLANIFPIEWQGVSERTNDEGTFTIRFWSYQEDCALYYTEA